MVTPVVVLPAFTAVFGASAKFTVLPLLTVTVRDSDSVAFSVTVPVFELICAEAGGTFAATKSRAPVAINSLYDRRIYSVSFFSLSSRWQAVLTH